MRSWAGDTCLVLMYITRSMWVSSMVNLGCMVMEKLSTQKLDI
jgi:hypothetical protein